MYAESAPVSKNKRIAADQARLQIEEKSMKINK